MKLESLYEDEHKLIIRVTGVSPSYINTIRRYMSSRVPTMAIDFVEFKINNSILYDEMIAHRLGLLALTTDLKTYKLPTGEWDNPTGDPRVECQLTLKVPKVKQDTVVRAKDLTSKDDKIQPVHPNTPIVKLAEGQEIQLIATARLGIGEEHAKWSPAHVWYQHYPHIKIKKQPGNAENLAEQYPDVFTIKNKKLTVAPSAPYSIPDKDLGVDEVDVTTQEDDFVLMIESWGQLSPQDIFTTAINAYNDQLDEFSKLAKEVN